MKKYELIPDDTIRIAKEGELKPFCKLFRVRALIDFADVKAGDLGGFIQSEKNLSHDGNAWVYDSAKVYGDAKVYGNALVFDNAEVYGNAKVFDNACVFNNAEVSGDAEVYGKAKVYGNAWVYDNAKVYEYAEVNGNAKVYGDAEVYGKATVSGVAEIYGDATIKSQKDYIVFKNSWSSFRWFTYTKSNKMWKVGCFYGTGQELIEKAYADSENSGNHYKAYVDLVETLEQLNEERYV